MTGNGIPGMQPPVAISALPLQAHVPRRVHAWMLSAALPSQLVPCSPPSRGKEQLLTPHMPRAPSAQSTSLIMGHSQRAAFDLRALLSFCPCLFVPPSPLGCPSQPPCCAPRLPCTPHRYTLLLPPTDTPAQPSPQQNAPPGAGCHHPGHHRQFHGRL